MLFCGAKIGWSWSLHLPKSVYMVVLMSALITGLVTLVGAEGIGVGASDDQEARAVVRKALNRVTSNEEQQLQIRYRSLMSREVRKFNGDGEVEESDQGDFEVFPLDGVPYERRTSVNGRPLSDQELEWEAEREAEFLQALQRIRDGEVDADDDEDRVIFNEELIERYVFSLEGEEVWRGRPSYAISFRPRDGDLPVRRRIDHALNKARGKLWIDRVRLWWGALGTIAEARGSLDRAPVLGDIWGRIQYETYTDVRVLFRRTRRAELRQWRAYESFEPKGPGGSQ